MVAAELKKFGTGAKKRDAKAPGLSMHDIIKKSASVLRQDGTITMRSYKESPPDRRNPLFPLRTVRMEGPEEEGAPRRLTEEAAQGALMALNHLAGFGASGPVAISSSSPSARTHEAESGVRSNAEKRVSRLEQNPHCHRVVESFFPECDFYPDVTTFGEEEILLQLSLKYSNVGLIFVGAGPPCQGVSGLNADKQGALRDARSCLFQEIPRITSSFRRLFHWAQVHELVENVASMSDTDRTLMSRKFERVPYRIDSRGISFVFQATLVLGDLGAS